MVESEYSQNNYKSLEISIRVMIENPKRLRFVPDHLKTRRMCKHAAKK